MCWGLGASTSLGILGMGASVYFARIDRPKEVVTTMAYFSLIELLQAATYLYLDDCDNAVNQILTLTAAFLIVFQPILINFFYLVFLPYRIRLRIRPAVFIVSAFVSVVMLLQLYPFTWAGPCEVGRILCAQELCSVHGSWHLAWHVPVNGMLGGYGLAPLYVFSVFILPVVYGSWKMPIVHALVGPTLAYTLTSDPNEWPAIWCLFSVCIIGVCSSTRLMRALSVNSHPLWVVLRLT